MEQIINIQDEKIFLRKKYKHFRETLLVSAKEELDKKIIDNILNTDEYKQAQCILTYVATPNEIETVHLIEKTIECGKKVAAPCCIANSYEIDFYYINSYNDLKIGTFGVLEPLKDRCEKVIDFTDSICIVPAFAFDLKGFRLGYGKGYYDRFLSKYFCKTIGLSYSKCIVDSLPRSKYDKNVDIIITENEIKRT